jgi:hypothetical protein
MLAHVSALLPRFNRTIFSDAANSGHMEQFPGILPLKKINTYQKMAQKAV